MGYVSLQEGKSFFLETLQGPLEFKTPPIAGPGSKSLGLYMRFSHQLGFSTFIPPMAIGLLRFFTRNIYIYPCIQQLLNIYLDLRLFQDVWKKLKQKY